MAMRSQVWKWDNMQGALLVAIAAGVQDSIFIGVFGTGAFFNRSITKPAETTATQFVVIEDIGCSPPNIAFTVGTGATVITHGDGVVQVRINTTDYFVRPDGLPEIGVPGVASPYPRTSNFYKFFDLYPDVYILPGQVWDILYATRATVLAGDLVEAFVKYTLYDGPDALIANKLLEMGITVNPNNIDWYKRTLIEQQQAAAAGAMAPPAGGV